MHIRYPGLRQAVTFKNGLRHLFRQNAQNLSTTTLNIHEELIDGCRVNNRKSQLQVYNLYYKAMYNTAYRIIGESAEAEDVMQESFLAAFQKIGEYKGESTFGAWLKRIVVNRALDQLRKKKEMLPLDEENMEKVADKQEEDYMEVLAYKVEQIRNGIERLQDDDRIIISLFLIEGYDHEEIAGILDITNNASRTRYSRARHRLRDLLSKEKINEMIN